VMGDGFKRYRISGSHMLDGRILAPSDPNLAHTINSWHLPRNVFGDGLSNCTLAYIWDRAGRWRDHHLKWPLPCIVRDNSIFQTALRL